MSGDQAIHARSLNLNINLIGGSAPVIAAAILLFLGTTKRL